MPMIDPQWIALYIVLGAAVGFAAGLLGIGGGAIMVPVLTSLFIAQGFAAEQVVHMALGTSMASIVIAAFSSMRAHHKRGGVEWPAVKGMVPGIVIGSYLGTVIAAHLESKYLAIIFSCFMAYVALQMILNRKPDAKRARVGTVGLFSAGGVIGTISSLVSIGGGTLTVPFLVWQNIDLKKAIGTSSAVGFPIALAGTIGYLVNGWANTDISRYIFGFVNVPAVLAISISSVFFAPLGASVSHKLPVNILRMVFAALIVGLCIKMLSTVV